MILYHGYMEYCWEKMFSLEKTVLIVSVLAIYLSCALVMPVSAAPGLAITGPGSVKKPPGAYNISYVLWWSDVTPPLTVSISTSAAPLFWSWNISPKSYTITIPNGFTALTLTVIFPSGVGMSATCTIKAAGDSLQASMTTTFEVCESVPEFPVGEPSVILLGASIALLLFRRKFNQVKLPRSSR